MDEANRALLFLKATLASVAAFPVTVLLHELGHYGAAVAMGFREPRLRAFVTEYVQGDYPEPQRVFVSAAGLLVTTLLTVGVGSIAARKPSIPLLAVTLAAPARAAAWVPILVLVAQGKATIAGGDEVRLAQLTRLPLAGFIGFGFVLIGFALTATIVALRLRPVRERAPILIGLFVGFFLGWIGFAFLGPRWL